MNLRHFSYALANNSSHRNPAVFDPGSRTSLHVRKAPLHYQHASIPVCNFDRFATAAHPATHGIGGVTRQVGHRWKDEGAVCIAGEVHARVRLQGQTSTHTATHRYLPQHKAILCCLVGVTHTCRSSKHGAGHWLWVLNTNTSCKLPQAEGSACAAGCNPMSPTPPHPIPCAAGCWL